MGNFMTEHSQSAHPAEQPKFNAPYAYFVAILLAVVYTFNFLDRQVLAILQEAIRKDLNLSDTQLGMLTGLNFAIVYTTLGLPVAWLADRSNRVRIIAVACGIWSVPRRAVKQPISCNWLCCVWALPRARPAVRHHRIR
jgi:sugar phosphate permease